VARPISYELEWMIWPFSLGVIMSSVALQTDRILIADLQAHLRPRFSFAGSPEEATPLRTYKNPDVSPNSCLKPAALFCSMSSPNGLRSIQLSPIFSIASQYATRKWFPPARELRGGKAVLRRTYQGVARYGF